MIKLKLSFTALLSVAVCAAFSNAPFAVHAETKSKGRILNDTLHHLGDDDVTIVPGTSFKPEGQRLDVKFHADKNPTEKTVALTYWDINYPTAVEINGQKIETIPPANNRKTVYLRVPAMALRDGENQFSIIPRSNDDCVIGKIVLHDQTFRDFMKLEPVTISVKDSKSGKPIPARVTITDRKGNLAEVFLAPEDGTAVRKGLVYLSRETEFELRKGDYVIYANRGMEWSRDKQKFSVKPGELQKVNLQIRREVDTTGFVACDTHIHTLTFSGHGDATVQERMVTLAGEGIELAVATDHNHHTDYRPFQKALGLNRYFTPVTGNEITTKFGHINGFPMPPDGPIPNQHETNWVKLVDDIRFRGAKVVILNHPRWNRSDVFAGLHLNTLTGEQSTYKKLPFDGMELANSSAGQTEALDRFADWFALLNHGENLKAVGSSDAHYVFGPVGQGRTYLRSSTDDPTKISIDEACENFLAGHSSISLGMFARITVENRFHPGDLVPVKGGEVHVKFHVAGASWSRPQRAILFLNGVAVAEQAIKKQNGVPLNQDLEFTIPAPKFDAHLVCVALGDRITEPFWPMGEHHTLAANNPVFLDADNDGVYRSPRKTAEMILAKEENNLDAQWSTLKQAGDGVASQMLSVIYQDADSATKNALRKRLKQNATTRPMFGKFLELAEAETAK